MNTTITGKMPTQKDALEIDAATLLARRQEYVERLRRNVPQEMRERKWWVHHGLGKQPVRPNGKGLSRWGEAKNHHLTMDDALATLMKAPPDVAGVGVILPKADKGNPLPAPPISCIDLDHCLNEDGTPKDAPGVQEILKRFGQHYMETSPSGGGLHIWYCGPWPPGVTTKTLFRGAEVEAWERNHFVTVTGNVWAPPGGTPTKELVEAGEEVGWLNRSLKTEGVPAGKAKDKADKTGADKEQSRQAADMERPAEPQRTDAATKITRPTPDRAELRKLLDEMPQDCRDNYAPWIDVGMALHDATGGSEEGWGLWDEWSRGSAKYKGPDETRRKWASFRTGGGRGIGTLYFYAGRTVPDSRPPAEDFAEFINPDWKPGEGGDASGEAPGGGAETASDGATGTAGQAGACPLPPGFSLVMEGKNAGLWHTETNDDGDPIRTWIGPPLIVLGMTRDSGTWNGGADSWGLRLSWKDPDGGRHFWAMPKALLEGDQAEYRKQLASGGWSCAPNKQARAKLALFLATVKPKARFLCVPRTGWHGDVYVFPDETIGEEPGGEQTVLQTASLHNPFAQSGTLEEWRDSVATLALGNSRVMLALCASFAAAQLSPCGQESGGFHLVGGSSQGKTIALLAACSVWGRAVKGGEGSYMETWRATDNGLEGAAALHSDALLPLDEVGQASSRVVNEVAYMLSQGKGKSRARRDGTARAAQNWRIMMVSTGEVGLAERIEADGGRAMAGQQVRLLDIPATADMTKPEWGVVEDLHGLEDSQAVVMALQDAAGKYYGTAARAFIRKAQEMGLEMIGHDWRGYRETTLETLTGPKADGQTKRAAERFLLCALAGEYAAAWGILPWPQGAAYQAVVKCFKAWLDRRGGTGPAEEKSIVERVTLFLEAHGQSRFQDLDLPDEKVINRVGFRKSYPEEPDRQTEYYVFSQSFKSEVVKGHDYKQAARVLRNRGMLLTEERDHLTVRRDFPGVKDTRFHLLVMPTVSDEADADGTEAAA